MSGLSFWVFFLLLASAASYDAPLYDFTAYTECKLEPERPLYDGGILKHKPNVSNISDALMDEFVDYTPAFVLRNLTENTIYCFSMWAKVDGASSAHVTARLKTDNKTFNCVGSVLAKRGCWSFLKGGFVLDSPSSLSILFFEASKNISINIEVASASLQPFTQEQWRTNQQYIINSVRKRAVTIHVSDERGKTLRGAEVTVEQISKDFPIGSAIASPILDNLPYQQWFTKRFGATVFENELKWYATEKEEGNLNYTVSDKMMNFVRANKLIARGHNIFWEDPKYNPDWVRNLTREGLRSAVNRRIWSLMNRYGREFVHWDVSNEMLHFDFYEQQLGGNATFQFYQTARQMDPLATLFLNEYNVVEKCGDTKSTVDEYVRKIRELERDGISMNGIGLEGHFKVPNLPLMRGVLDKLATLNLPIWLTEVDINSKFDQLTQAVYLEQVLREGFSHPAVNGIMMWTAFHPNGCYQMCLTDENFQNLPAGDVVDDKLQEWNTGEVKGVTDEHGSFSFFGFLGDYNISLKKEGSSEGGGTVNSTFSLCRGPETKHLRLQI